MRTALSFLLLLPTVALAAPPDVPQDAWYASTVSAFVDAGYFPNETAFRAGDNATRAEFIELIVKLQGGVTIAPTRQSFDDVSLNASYYGSFEQAASSGWMKGAGSCLGTHPCLAKPESSINRAEASAILQRAFGISLQGEAPSFKDNPEDQWFTEGIRLAASNCVLQGDAGTGRVRPADNMNRAEMLVMIDRLHRKLTYPQCSVVGKVFSLPRAPIVQASSSSSKGAKMCTETAWECSEWRECTGSKQSRTCTIIDTKCMTPYAVMPNIVQDCMTDAADRAFQQWQEQREQSSQQQQGATSRGQALLDNWKKLHEEILQKYKDISEYSVGNETRANGLQELYKIESDFVLRYNEFINYGCVSNPDAEVCVTIRMSLEKCEKDFRDLPTIYF